MSVQLRGTDAGISIRWIPKYTTLERVLHWVHTAAFIPLSVTGFIIYASWLMPLSQGAAGESLRLIHRTPVWRASVPPRCPPLRRAPTRRYRNRLRR